MTNPEDALNQDDQELEQQRQALQQQQQAAREASFRASQQQQGSAHESYEDYTNRQAHEAAQTKAFQQHQATRDAAFDLRTQTAAAKDQAKEQLRQQNDAREQEYRSQGRPSHVDAHGAIQPDHSEEEWQRLKQARANIDTAAQSGRKYVVSKVTGEPIYLESEEQQAQKQAAAGEALRKTRINDQLKANAADYEFQKQNQGIPKLLTDNQKKKLAQEHQTARINLAGALEPKTQEQSGTNDWIPFNEAPTDAANAAKAQQTALTSPDKTTLTAEELAQHEASDSTKPHAQKIRNIQDLLAKDAQARQFHADYKARQTGLVLRRDAPDKWLALQQQNQAKLSPTALQDHLQGSAADIQAKQAQLQQAYAPIQQQQAQFQAQHAALVTANEQRKQQGIPANEIVTYKGPDGQPETWAKDLAAQRETLVLQHQQAQATQAPALATLKQQHTELQQDIDLHNQGIQLAQQKEAAQKQSFIDSLKANPATAADGHALDALEAEKQTRIADIKAVNEGQVPPEAAAAVEKDIQAKQQAILQQAQTAATEKQDTARAAAIVHARLQKADEAFIPAQKAQEMPYPGAADPAKLAAWKEQVIARNKDFNVFHAQKEQELMGKAGLDPANYAHHTALADVRAADFSGTKKIHIPEGAPLRSAYSKAMEAKGGKPIWSDYVRTLSDGSVLVNPRFVQDNAHYAQAVDLADATPEAKAAAMAALPDLQLRHAATMLPMLRSMPSVPGIPTFQKWKDATKPTGSDAEQARDYLQAMNARGFWSKIGDTTARNLIAGLSDIGTQTVGTLGLLSGSQTLSEAAAGWSRDASNFTAPLEAEGGNSSLVGSVLGQTARMAGPMAAMILVTRGLGAGMGTAAAIAGAQTAGSQYADAYNELREQGVSHDAAWKQTAPYALASGLVTALLTKAGGKIGLKTLLKTAAEHEASAARAVAQGFWKHARANIPKQALAETAEELPDELFSQVSQYLSTHPHATEQDTAGVIGDFWKNSPSFLGSIMLMGGAGGVHESYQETRPLEAATAPAAPHPANLPETVATAEKAIDDLHIEGQSPEVIQKTQDAARGVLYVAQGTPLTDLDRDTLASLDLVEDPKNPGTFINGRVVTGKNGTPEIQEYKAGLATITNADGPPGPSRPVRVRMENGQPVITQQTLDNLEKILPAVRAAIPLDENSQRTKLTAAKSGSTPAGQTPAHGPNPDANHAAVQNPPSQGAQPPPSGNSSAQSGTPVTSTPETQQRAAELATILESRGLTAPQAQHAAEHVVKQQGIVGASAEEQFSQGIDTDMGNLGWVRGSGKNYTFIPKTLDAKAPERDTGSLPVPPPASETSASAKPPSTTVNAAKQPSATVNSAPGSLDPESWISAVRSAKAKIPTANRRSGTRIIGLLEKHLFHYAGGFKAIRFASTAADHKVSSAGGGMHVEPDGTLVLDLPQIASQFSGLLEGNRSHRAENALKTSIEEELIHAVQLQHYGYDETAALFNSLPDALQAEVWRTYRVTDLARRAAVQLFQKSYTELTAAEKTRVDQAVATHASPKKWAPAQAAQLYFEFERMLVSDKAFAGRVSEAAAADPSFGQKLLDWLNNVIARLRNAIADAPQPIRVQIAEREAALTKALKALTKTLDDQSGDARAQLSAKHNKPDLTQDNRPKVSGSGSGTGSLPVPAPVSPFTPVLGSTGTVYTDANDAIEYQWAVVDVNSLHISNHDSGTINPAYPQELQPRDRTSAASEAQVADIAKNMNLGRLSSSNTVGDGAPIIGQDAVAESGNGRLMGMRRAWLSDSNAARGYRSQLIGTAGAYGLNAEQVEAVPHPVLVRIRTTEVHRPTFVLSANVSTISPKREIEQAKIDAKQMVPDLFEHFVPSEDGDIFTAANADFIRGFISTIIPPAERPAVIDNAGNLTQAGLRRIRNAIFVHAYGSSPETLNALARISESIDTKGAHIATALVALAPRFAELNARENAGALYPLSITQDLAWTVQKLQDLRNRNESVTDFLAQDRIPGIGDDPTPMQRRLLTFFDENAAKPRVLVNTLSRYAAAFDAAGDPRQTSLFGDTRPTREELFDLSSNTSPVLASSSKSINPKAALGAYRKLREIQDTKGRLDKTQNLALAQARQTIAARLFSSSKSLAAEPLPEDEAPEQPHETAALDAELAKARLAKPNLDNFVHALAAEFKGRAVTPGLKGRVRSTAKARTDYGGDFTKLKDLARATIECTDLAQAKAIVAEIERRTGRKAKRNLLDQNPVDGYRDALFNLEFDGYTTEMQVHIPEVLKVKHQLHTAYVIRTEIERKARSENRQPTHAEWLRIDRMNRIMRKFYNAALGLPHDLGASPEELARRGEPHSGTSSSASSRFTANPPRLLSSSSEMGLGGSSSNAQPSPLASRTTAKASLRSEGSGTSKNPVAPGNDDGFFTSEHTTSPQENQRITTENVQEMNPNVDVSALAGTQKHWRKAFNIPGTPKLVALAKLTATKHEPQSVQNAARFIAQAISGTKSARAPIDVSANPDGTYTVQDGNATAQALMLAGWKAIPVHIVATAPLAKSRTALDDTPDLFSFNTGLGLDTLLTPAQKESKLQHAETLDLFAGTSNARPRPTAQRPARPARASRPASTPEQSSGADDLFAAPGLAGNGNGQRPALADAAGHPGSLGGRGNPTSGGSTTSATNGPTAADSLEGSGSSLSGMPADGGDSDVHRLDRPSVGSPDRNFEVPDSVESLAPSTDKAKILANLAAIRLLKELEDQRRNPTAEEKKTLAAYTGWGAFKEAFNSKYEGDIADYWDGKPAYQRQHMPDWLQSWEKNHRPLHKLLRENMTEDEFSSASASTLNAHYTAAPIIRAMWKMVERLGFTGGRAIEPSAGAGHYLGLQPSTMADQTAWQTVELDDLSARLLSKLYPEATVNESRSDPTRLVSGLGFERARIPNGSLDLAISNVPFHESGPRKKGFPALNLHNFFFAHALDKVKPGGLVAFITSESTMQNNMKQRDFIASKGDLVAAFRLPNNAFKATAGTEVTTDIIILRKPDGTPFKGQPWRNLNEVGRQTITLTQGKDQTAEELRREAERTGDIVGKEYWKNGKRAFDVSAPIMVNEYFVNHPQHVLGTHTLASTMYRAGGYAVVAPDGLDVPAALDALIPSLPANVMGHQSTADTPDVVLASREDRPFSFKEQDGKIYEVQPDGSMEEAEWGTNPELVKIWRSWKRVSQAVEELVAAETSDDYTDTALDQMRRALGIAYNTHVTAYKPISRRFSNNHRHLYSDPSYPLTAALENEVITVDPKTSKKTYTYKKADIFTKRIGRPIVLPKSAKNVDDALELSLAWKGRIDPDYAASLLKITPAQFTQQALQRPDIFENPSSSLLEQAEEYLTGNVRTKLASAEAAAQDNPRFQKNVDALRAAQPERKEIARIMPVLGARWIPAEVYNAFIKDVLHGQDTVEYIPAGNSWIISGPGVYHTEEHGTERKGPASLFKHALDMTEPMVYDGSGENRTFNPTDTAAAKTALDKMRRAFIDYVKTSDTKVEIQDEESTDAPTRSIPVWEATEDAFNESNNSYVTPRHTGAYLKFPGLNTDYVYTKAHRRAVIARFLNTRRGMMAHGVGSGKTFNQIILAQEMRRLGLAKKPLIVVQNATLGQFAKSYLKAYPAARILVPTKSDFEAGNRRKLVAKIATGNWDAVILPHSQFDLISNKPSSVKAYMDSQIDELMAIVNKTKDKAKVRDLEGMVKRLKDRRQDMLDKLAARQDTAVMWEDLGIDALIMDEAHNYKSLPIITRMGRVKGVPASGNSQRAINFMLKCRDVQARTGGKNIFLATGTPIKNSMAEAYIMMQFMAPDVLQEFGIHNFDDFATSYGQTVTEAEMAWGGTPKMETRFAKFQNGSALVTMIRTMFDVAFGNAALGLDVPRIKGGEPEMLIVPATPDIDKFNAWTRSVNEAWKKADPKEKEEYTAVPIQTMAAGIAAALDPRLIAPSLPDDPQSKVNHALRRVAAIYKAGTARKTTQIIFSDLRNPFSMDYLLPFTGHPFPDHGSAGEFDLYKDIKAKLVASGVPENEIHLMQSGMTDVKKAALFEKVDSGEVRIIIGSTELLGVGVNIQTRLKAVHHLMPPRDFTPAMMEQRNGRIIRQGNLHSATVEGQPAWNDEVEIVNYGTEGSMDSAIYGTLARKQRFITQLLMGEDVQDSFDDPTDPVAVNMAEMAARTLGDPDFIRRITLEKEIKDLRLQAEAFTNELSGKRSRLSRLESQIRSAPAAIQEAQTEAARLTDLWKRTAPRPEGVKEDTDISAKPVFEFDGQTIDTAIKGGGITNKLDLHLLEISTRAERRGNTKQDFTLTINGHPLTIEVHLTLPGNPTPGYVIDSKGRNLFGFNGANSLFNNLHRAPADAARKVDNIRDNTAQAETQATKLRGKLATIGTFPEAERLSSLEQEAREVDERLRAKSSPPPTPTGTPARTGPALPEMRPVDPALMTSEVESVIDNADIEGNKLFLPDQLDRKLYEKVNRALESAGGVWSKRDKAHLFAGDPRPYLGLAPMPALSTSRKSLASPPEISDTASYDSAPLDPFTGAPSLITGSHVSRQQGAAIGHEHARRLRAGLREGKEQLHRDGLPLAQDRSGAFSVASPSPHLPSVPLVSQSQFAKILRLPKIGEGAEALVYADHKRGVVYKVLQGYGSRATLGIWPQVMYTSAGRLDYHLAPAERPRQLATRLAVQTLLGGTPTEVVGVGPDGHVILKQPLSPDPTLSGTLAAPLRAAGLVEVPRGILYDPKGPRVFIGWVEGRPWLIMDVKDDNFVGDNQGDSRLNDPIVVNITADIISKVPGLSAVVRSAHQQAQSLGDRSARLFTSTKSLQSPFTPAVRIDGRVETADLHYTAWIRHALRAIPAYQKDGLDRSQLHELADQWLSQNPGYLADSQNKEGFMTPDGFMNRQDALQRFRALGYDQTLYPGEERDWLDSTDVEHALSKSSTSVSAPPSPNSPLPSPLAKLGWNHLDRALSAKVAAHTRWARESAAETVARWTNAPSVKPFAAAYQAIKKELLPDSMLPPEILARRREMEIKTAMGSQRAMDLVRALSGNPKFSDIAFPAKFAQNPKFRRDLYEAMAGERPMSSLDPELQALATKLRAILVKIGQEAVKQGRMSIDTFDNLRGTYMPHFYEQDVKLEKSLFKKFRLGMKDILAQRTTAWHITDTSIKDANGEARLVSHQGNQWRFKNAEHMNAFYQDFINQQALEELRTRYGKKYKALTAADINAPSKLDPEVRGRLQEIKRALSARYERNRPLTIGEQEKAGLIMDPVYSIARYAAQMAHDNSTAEFFNTIAATPAYISTIATPGFDEIPDNPRFGRLAGKFVSAPIAQQVLELADTPNTALAIYDTLMGWWKTGKTVLNPGTHVRNVLGNLFFSQLAGSSLHNPGNLPYYRQAIQALRQGGPLLTEAYDHGVLGADFVSAELRQTLRQLLPDPATIEDDGKAPGILMGMGKAIGKVLPVWAKNPLSQGYNKVAALYQAEDEVFKLAAYLKSKAMFAADPTFSHLPSAISARAAAHVRQWFPYFDSGSSGTLRLLGRTAIPFLGFYRESIRIFGEALKHRPLALATGLSIPSILTALSAMLLGLSDDDREQVKKDMRGKAGKLLGLTPLEGMPLFSILLPSRSSEGTLQQFDISAIHPFVDFLGNRVESTTPEDWWQKTLRSFIAAGPLGSLLYSQMTGKDTFGDRQFVENNMTGTEKLLARADNVAKTLLPPLAPFGTGFTSLLHAGERSTNKTFETRNTTQTALRTLGGLDVRNASPDLYRLADDWRKSHGYNVQEGMDYGGTTPVSRARKALFTVLAQDHPSPTAVKSILTKLKEFGHPITSQKDIDHLLAFRDPLQLIGGDKARGITAQAAQAQFLSSLHGEALATLNRSRAEFQKIQQRAPMLLRTAQ